MQDEPPNPVFSRLLSLSLLGAFMVAAAVLALSQGGSLFDR